MTGAGVGGGEGILLGPERTTGAPVWCGVVVSVAWCRLSPNYVLARVSGLGCGWWVWVVVGLLFENCIVDASIFVVKLLRADGGCLGTGSR